MTSWLFAIFGESQLAVLYLTDGIVRSPCSELRFPEVFSSEMVNFYPIVSVYGLVGGWITSPLNHVTKNDTDGEVSFAGISTLTNPVFRLVLNVNRAYVRLRHQYHFW
jgi:hypothetical protein